MNFRLRILLLCCSARKTKREFIELLFLHIIMQVSQIVPSMPQQYSEVPRGISG